MQKPGIMVKRWESSLWAKLIPLSFLVSLFLAVGCQSKKDSLPAASLKEDSLPRFGRIAKSPDQLVRNALIRLSMRDTLGLLQMMPGQKLFLEIFDRTPEGKSATEILRNFAPEYYFLDNRKLLFRRLSRDGGKDLELISWKPTNSPIPLEGGGEILRDLEIRVREKADTTVRRLFYVQSIYVDSIGCKIWGFSDEKAQ
jgi:hypothetical protein